MRSTHVYGENTREFGPGQRVATHPATGPFMQGDRYGTVARVGRRYVDVTLDSGRPWSTVPANLAHMADG